MRGQEPSLKEAWACMQPHFSGDPGLTGPYCLYTLCLTFRWGDK